MPRVKRSVATKRRKKKILKQAKGAFGLRSKVYRRAKETVLRALRFAYHDRRARKREFRKLWNIRINAGLREHGMNYSYFIGALKKHNILLDRKILAELAVNDKNVFAALIEKVKTPRDK